MVYDRNSSERIENGLYEIDGELWFSIWTFKNKFGIVPNNNSANLKDAILISSAFNDDHITIIPDIGNFGHVKGFREHNLKDFYRVE
ncbi:hypothetical protein SJS85_00170 [Aeromonas caviae]|uniref:hypothetical protein n=1 Tax=Aeromonas caviae TaxID=648 RepID=UPI0029D44478|nr:hypothetical protein [Aeromonas caviae]MDX7833847.1 hypothetical protein [Aeromonas caviae]